MPDNNTDRMKWLKGRPIAHRGLYSHSEPFVPENSMAAFARAIAANYAIELDVQVIADEEVVVFHDNTLTRMCGKESDLDKLYVKDISDCYLTMGLDKPEVDETIPLLSDVLQLVKGSVPLLIEIKRQSHIKNANVIILNALQGYPGPYAIQCFDPKVLGWWAQNAPYTLRGQLSSDLKGEKYSPLLKFGLRNFMFNFISKPHFVAYDVKDMPRRRLASMRKKGIPVLGWTVKDKSCYERIKDYCDNIIFEGWEPDVL